ncbi:MAG: ribosome biogenesis GTPase YlqF, partial [Lachnospiraceae bacterium]|nr:ribosome biogenesis GTPase YlqF [Lachnospiraceae bacterium]
MHFQWYPGHMTKAKRMMLEDIKLIDLIIELVDARVPVSSKNPDIDKLANGKSRVILLNKYDLADREANERWKQYYEDKGFLAALVNAKTGSGLREVSQIIDKACQAKIERDRKRGIKNRPVRAMIVGIPNVGKSTFINSYAGKACTKTGNKPGVTKGKQWIRLNKQVELLDTPGILWPKFEDQSIGMKLAFIGSIKEELLQRVDLCLELIEFLKENYPAALSEEYQIKTIDDNVKMLENIA